MPVDVLDPVAGDAPDVSAAGRTLESMALDVASIARRLRALASGDDSWGGAAARSARARAMTLPPRLDKADASYSAAGRALRSYAESLADAQHQSETAIANAGRAAADLQTAQAGRTAAAQHDAQAAALAQATQAPPPAATAVHYEGAIEEATVRLARARALNEQAHEQQRTAAKAAASALQQASHEGIHNQSWLHHFTQAVGHWASTHWETALRDLSKVASTVSALAGIAALVLSIAGVLFPPLEAAAAVLETVSLVSAVVAGAADTALAASGKTSWTAVGMDALTLAPAGLGAVVTKAAPVLRESRLVKPTTVVHASTGDAIAAAAVRSVSDASRAAGAGQAGIWANPARLLTHFRDHGADFGATSPEEYAAMASEFFSTSQQLRLPTKISPDGTIRVFDRDSNTFGSYTIYGAAKTFFKPTSPTYWERQKGILIEHLRTP